LADVAGGCGCAGGCFLPSRLARPDECAMIQECCLCPVANALRVVVQQVATHRPSSPRLQHVLGPACVVWCASPCLSPALLLALGGDDDACRIRVPSFIVRDFPAPLVLLRSVCAHQFFVYALTGSLFMPRQRHVLNMLFPKVSHAVAASTYCTSLTHQVAS
jgi:hypothetical protein